jgi:DNA modification methylase
MKILNWEAILWDCLEEMKKIESNSIDLTVTSPPYDNLRTYKGNLQWCFEWIAKELFRITKPWWVVVWVVWDATIKWSESWTSFRQALFFKDIGFNLHDTMIYNKWNTPFPDKNRYYQCFEYMFIFTKWNIKTFNPIQDRKNKCWWEQIKSTTLRQKDWTLKITSAEKLYWNKQIKEYWSRFNIWDISPWFWKSHTDKEWYLHPATFPEKLAEDHILSWSNEWDIVLDCFWWSFTTWKMAELNNRKWICIEKEKEYFDIWIKRLNNLQSSLSYN